MQEIGEEKNGSLQSLELQRHSSNKPIQSFYNFIEEVSLKKNDCLFIEEKFKQYQLKATHPGGDGFFPDVSRDVLRRQWVVENT